MLITKNDAMTSNTNLSFTLKEISSWTKDDSNVKIPELQRGLVWKPAQVELLWDSILRGFPIGSFCSLIFLIIKRGII